MSWIYGMGLGKNLEARVHNGMNLHKETKKGQLM